MIDLSILRLKDQPGLYFRERGRERQSGKEKENLGNTSVKIYIKKRMEQENYLWVSQEVIYNPMQSSGGKSKVVMAWKAKEAEEVEKWIWILLLEAYQLW